MKIRRDFVSNSSSSSFVVAVNKEYDLASFCKDLAKASVNKHDKYHNDTVEKMNEANAFFNLFHNELVFLGQYLIETREDTYAKKDLPIKINDACTFDQTEWDRCKRNIEKWEALKDKPDDDYHKICMKFASKDYIDDNEVLHTFYDYYVGLIAVDMSDFFDIKRSDWFEDLIAKGEGSEQQVKLYEEQKVKRLDAIKALCRQHKRLEYGESSAYVHFPRTYQITKSTIKNTRDMIAAGLHVELDKWENLDELEKRLDAGQKLFCIHNNYQGDGWDKDAIYSEDDCELLSIDNSMAMEYLNSESY